MRVVLTAALVKIHRRGVMQVPLEVVCLLP
jgi:hypothetical protein